MRKATVEQFRADYDNTVALYRQTVLTTFQQVEDNLASLRILAQQIGLAVSVRTMTHHAVPHIQLFHLGRRGSSILRSSGLNRC